MLTEPNVSDTGSPALTEQPARSKPAGPPLCIVVDSESSTRQFISLILHGLGIDTIQLADGAALRAARVPRAPDLIIHEVSLDSVDAIESLLRLHQRKYDGPIQLISRRGAAVLEHVRGVGLEHKLNMLPVLKKPFAAESVVKLMRDLRLGLSVATAATVNLGEAISGNWIEFWHQPIINLRKKELVGTEMYARVNHPEAGIVLPAGFVAQASPTSLEMLTEIAVKNALRVGESFKKLGLEVPISVNIPIETLEKLPIDKLVLEHHSNPKEWPGLIVDIAESQVLANLGLVARLAGNLTRVNVNLAIDNFGRGYQSLISVKELPFAQIKLDRMFIQNCGTDRVNAPRTKAMIELAHRFERKAVAIGIESAGEAAALVTMGCDYGQGYLLGQPMPETHFESLLRERVTKRGRAKAQAAGAPRQAV
jgi:EAL domain-containing protein (putative c-di-GMP-specific phosphodiesterase class I)